MGHGQGIPPYGAVRPMGHGQGIPPYGAVRSMGHGQGGWLSSTTVRPMGHGKGILPYSTVQPMGHGAHTPSYGPWVMGICTCRTATYGPWVMGFCHAVWPMTHGEKVAETCADVCTTGHPHPSAPS